MLNALEHAGEVVRVGLVIAACVLISTAAFAQRPVEAAVPPPVPAEGQTTPPAHDVLPAHPQAAQPAQVCVPDCRSGFVCVAGLCVSACNPACAPGHQCAEGGRCIATPDAAAIKTAVKEALSEYSAEKQAEYRARTVRRHEGWYLRFGFNVGYAWDSAESRGVSTTSRGAGGFLEYALGGNVSDHVVMAFAHHTFGVFSPETSVDDQELDTDHTAFYHLVGVLFDYYPDPTLGWHVAATLGFSDADVELRDGEPTETGSGLALGGGYDLWVGDQWSLGMGARIIYLSGAADDFGDHKVIIPTLTFSALWH